MRLNTTYFRQVFRVLAIYIVVGIFPLAIVQAGQVCGVDIRTNAKYRVMFINGINNSKADACESADRLRLTLSFYGIPVDNLNFSYFHNPINWAGSGDILELKTQATLSEQAMVDSNSYGHVDRYYVALGKLYAKNIVSSPDNEILKTTGRLVDRLIELTIVKGESVILVPHSQGNFYIEAAYGLLKYFGRDDVLEKLRVVGVASVAASPPGDRYISIRQDQAVFTLQPLNAGLLKYRPAAYNAAACLSGPCPKPDGWSVTALFSVFSPLTLLHSFGDIYLGSLTDAISGRPLPGIVSDMVELSLGELGFISRFAGTISVPAKDIDGIRFVVPYGASRCQFDASGTWTIDVIGSTTSTPSGISGQVQPLGKVPNSLRGSLSVRRGGVYTTAGVQYQMDVTPGETLQFSNDEGLDFRAYADNTGSLTVNWICGPAGTLDGQYSKISNSGSVVVSSTAAGYGSNDWGCLRDNLSGYYYEAKMSSGPRAASRRFTNYTNTTTPQKDVGGIYAYATQADIDSPDNAITYVNETRASALCGRTNWSMSYLPIRFPVQVLNADVIDVWAGTQDGTGYCPFGCGSFTGPPMSLYAPFNAVPFYPTTNYIWQQYRSSRIGIIPMSSPQ